MSNLYEVNYNPDFNVQFMTNFFFSPLNHTHIFGLLHWASTLNSTTLCLPHFNIVINWKYQGSKRCTDQNRGCLNSNFNASEYD